MITKDVIRRGKDILKTEGLVALVREAGIPLESKILFKGYLLRLRGHPGIGHPLRVYEVSPDRIQYSVHAALLNDRTPMYGLVDGDWDKVAKKIPESNKIVKRYRDGLDWDEIESFQAGREQIEAGGYHGHLDVQISAQSVDDWYEYHSYLDDLYDWIKTEGYKSQRELTQSDDFPNRDMHPALNEIQLYIGRNGKLCVKSGRHRLYMAQLLDIERIPVRTQVRHPDWQAIRDSIARARDPSTLPESVKSHLDHPEIQDIVPKGWGDDY